MPCTALKAAWLLSCSQMKIVSLEWIKTKCNVREVRLRISRHNRLSAELNDVSTWRMVVSVMDLLWLWLQWQLVLHQLEQTLFQLSAMIHETQPLCCIDNCPVTTSSEWPGSWQLVLWHWGESRMNESGMRTLCACPILGIAVASSSQSHEHGAANWKIILGDCLIMGSITSVFGLLHPQTSGYLAECQKIKKHCVGWTFNSDKLH